MSSVSSFIYVFDEESRDKLLSLQYKLLKSDEQNHIFVFLNEERQDFSCNNIRFALSETLTF